jgi:hypothetical protein
MMYEATVKVYKLNVRADHTAGAEDIGDIAMGIKVVGDELYTAPNGEVWLRLPNWNFNGVVRVAWIATKFGGQDLCTVVNLGGTPPPPPPPATTKVIELVDDGVVWKGTLTRQ